MPSLSRTTCRLAMAVIVVLLGALHGALATEPGPPSTVRVAGVVLKWIRTDKEANLRRVEPMIREAAARGAEIVCTTECFLDGYAIADQIHIVFVHPAEFLVTGPDGTNLANTILGDQLLIRADEVGTEKDSQRVFYFDLPRHSNASRGGGVDR